MGTHGEYHRPGLDPVKQGESTMRRAKPGEASGQGDHCREGGFGLIEVMLAMVILAFAIRGVMGMFQWAEHGLRKGERATRALAMAEPRLEAKRTTGCKTVPVSVWRKP